MFGIGTQEILLILLVALLFFGGKKIPEMMRGLGKGVSEFKKGLSEIDNATKDHENAPPVGDENTPLVGCNDTPHVGCDDTSRVGCKKKENESGNAPAADIGNGGKDADFHQEQATADGRQGE